MEQISQYAKFIGLFEDFINRVMLLLPDSLSQVLRTSGNTIGVILILMFVYSKLKKGDFFEFQTFVVAGLFLGYLTFFNWSIAHPKDSQAYFRMLVEYPADQVMSALSTLKLEGYQASDQAHAIQVQNKTIDTLISDIFYATGDLVTRTFQNLKTSTILNVLPIVLAILVIAILEALFIFNIVYLICLTFIEISIYLALYVLFIPLVFFQQTRGFAWAYVKKVVSLTFYAPFVTLVSLLDYNILSFIKAGSTNIDALPQQSFWKSIFSTIHTKPSDYMDFLLDLTFMALGAFFCLKLVSKVPSMINFIFGTQGAIGDAGHFISGTISLIKAPLVTTAGLAKGGYTQGGVGGALANVATMGGYKGGSDSGSESVGGTVGGVNMGTVNHRKGRTTDSSSKVGVTTIPSLPIV
ncbi:type IV secretion system protein [Helicobacter baculiformis]|uniref:Type IV secretion system protein n=1 Tax=Helicobacter baculiformis TaxID=427351 RepID=A0ABV7ZK50_9HELI|nr:type IV secretion system protein [Helicobacter baculiformis]